MTKVVLKFIGILLAFNANAAYTQELPEVEFTLDEQEFFKYQPVRLNWKVLNDDAVTLQSKGDTTHQQFMKYQNGKVTWIDINGDGKS